jgi:hypothetical protein
LPKVATTGSWPGAPLAIARWESESASIVYAPRCSNIRRTTVFPVAMLPVRPMMNFPCISAKVDPTRAQYSTYFTVKSPCNAHVGKAGGTCSACSALESPPWTQPPGCTSRRCHS